MNNHPSSFNNQQNNQIQQRPALNFPLDVRIKILSISDQLYVDRQGSGRTVAFVRKKLLKLKEEIEIFTDKSKTRQLYTINADRIIDFSAEYHFYSVKDGLIGRTKQHGMKSIWRTQFDVLDDSGTRFFIKHKNPWVEAMEGLLQMIPFVGIFLSIMSGYFMNPVYTVTDLQGNEVAEMRMKPSFFESKYSLTRLMPLESRDQELIILSMLTTILMQARQDDGDGIGDFF